MSVFLADISSYEHGLAVAALADCAGILAKATEGTYYIDADYAGWRAQAKAASKLFIAYHFISGEDPDAQAAALAAHIGDPSLPVMLDWEPTGGYRPTLAQLYAVADAMGRRGLRVRLAYVPRWYWSQLGGPDLSGLSNRRIGMVSSAYPGGAGTAAQLYPGDGAAGWQPYGSVTPLLYQFTDQAADGGQRIDMNAYKGTALTFAAFLGAAAPTPAPPTGGTDVALTQQDITAVAAATATEILNRQIPRGGGGMTGSTSLAATTSWFDQQFINLAAAIATAPVVDAQALAASVVAGVLPHLPAAVDAVAFADAVATAVTSHVSGQAVDYQVLADTVSHALAARLAS